MGDSNANQAQQAFAHMVEGLFKRQATGRGVIAFELSEEVIAASLEGGAKQQNDAQVSDVSLQFFDDAAVFSARVRVKGKAWPPRPPVDTKVSFSAKEVTHSEVGQSGAVMFRVEKPLTFTSTFADVLAGVVGKLFGTRYLATLFGLTLLSHQTGGFLGAWLGGIAITETGDYAWMWYADMALAAAAAVVNLPIREAPLPRAATAA